MKWHVMIMRCPGCKCNVKVDEVAFRAGPDGPHGRYLSRLASAGCFWKNRSLRQSLRKNGSSRNSTSKPGDHRGNHTRGSHVQKQVAFVRK